MEEMIIGIIGVAVGLVGLAVFISCLAFYMTGEKTLGEVAWYHANSGGAIHPVGQKKPNAFGLYDMLGNVWEWTSTAICDFRVLRGGVYWYDARNCRSASHYRLRPDDRGRYFGLRLLALQDAP